MNLDPIFQEILESGGVLLDGDDWLQADVTNVPSVTAGVTTVCVSYVPD